MIRSGADVITIYCVQVYNKRKVLESPPDHPYLPPAPRCPVHGKTVFHETGPWCQKVWGLLHSCMDFPGSSVVKDSTSQSTSHGRSWFDPQVRKTPWRRKWQPTPVFLPGESHEQRSLAGYSPWGCKELDMSIYVAWTIRESYPHKTHKKNLHSKFHNASFLKTLCL